ncbi:multidrug resistance-associated protein 1-like [Saccostrea echinata]|uniref:multidrug resistance-associated protein 1-like n=1 Tax=Saccostrea echinata TaxID=191078 RepID=UPI002A7EAB3F|nr:multidrug resistance-associated protein 1-like [Saccostrea echinata]
MDAMRETIIDKIESYCSGDSLWILCSGLILLSILGCLETIYVNSLNDAVRQPEFMSSILTGITLIVANHIMWTERQQKIRSSGFLLTYWFLMFVSFSLTLQSRVRSLLKQDEMIVDTRFCVLSIQTLLSIANLIVTALFIDSFPEDEYKKPCVENSTSLSTLTFSWFTGVVREAYKRPLKAEDMLELQENLKSESTVPVFEKAWHNEINTLKGQMIDFAEDRNDLLWHGILFATVKFIVDCTQLLMANYDDNICHMIGIKIKTSICGALYRKMTKLSNKAKKDCTVGEMVNLMSDDAQRVIHALFQLHFLWIGPLQACVALYFLYQELKFAAVLGFSLFFIFIPLNVFIAKKHHKINKEDTDIKDKRMKVLNEVFNGMKVLKLYAWEPSFEDKIDSIRFQELRRKMKRRCFDAVSSFIWGISDFLVTFVIFAVYLWLDDSNVMTTKKIFYTISLLGILRGPILHMPHVITALVETSVALKRIQKFLNHEEIDESAIQHDGKEGMSIQMKNASFAWNRQKTPNLKNINIDIPDGGLVAIVGAVGAGKSSLLSAAIGEMEKISGEVCVNGSIAYVTQQAWIQNNSLKENLLFGKEMNGKNYNKAIDACALRTDLDILPGGDETEIGEKGINLSGGQKQRVSLARAVYQDADIYLLDDPLSAVDAHVGRHIFEKVIGNRGLLRNKTRVLVTHAISFLPNVDKIINIVNGEVSEVGTYNELMEQNGAFAEFVRNHALEESASDEEEQSDERPKVPMRQLSTIDQSDKGDQERTESKCKDSKFIEEEAIETGQVKWSVYTSYLKVAGRFLLVLFFLCLAENITDHYNQYWLSEWSSENTDNCTAVNMSSSTQHSRERYRLTVFGLIGMIKTIFDVLGQLSITYIAITSARKFHQNALSSVMRAPLSFFDTTPIGRIINRFSKDMETLDWSLPWITKSFLESVPHLLSTLAIITLGTPKIMYFVIPLCFVYFFIQRLFSATATQTRRICSALRSPQYSHFSESINGVTTLRAFNKTQLFTNESDRRQDAYNKAEVTNTMCYRWLGIRLQFIGNLLVFIACTMAVYRRDVLSSGMIALVMTYAGHITGILHWIVHIFTEMDTRIVSVERIQEYMDTKPEAEWRIKDTKPAPEWPQKGHVKFSNFGLRYREGLDLVLKEIDCEIMPGEKIGIVGRTGAGKSSLTLGLFRIIEKAEGSITIDDVDISTIGLHDLRSKLTIIPQDPILFSGTIRMNLDPFESYTDDELWVALEHAHLKKYVESLDDGLQHECSEGGENLSVGQRQLVCLARALLRKTKVLVLDEATAAVDLDTDNLIQKTIRQEFSDCTILTIAHRLNTIMDYSKIMVLDKGQIKEFESPETLLKDEDSTFFKMAKDANLV